MVNKKGSLLIVDDDDDMRNTLKELFHLKGYDVGVACDGFKAIEMCEKKSFDVVLLDFVMEEMDGMETLKRIKAIRSETSFFMMTAYLREGLQEMARENDVIRIFNKPFDIDDMLQVFDVEICRKCGDISE
jgi:DNA-binding NtrC family response regulator